jgi:protein-S-isoprenylcysteine O-methyltransferase Ste14
MADVSLFRRLLRQWESPPTWFALFLALTWAQSRWLPLWPTPRAVDLAGWLLIAAGIGLLLVAAGAFRRHGTTILPREVPAHMIVGGLYQYSRNPIYLADALALTGAALIFDSASLALVPLFMAVITRRFIEGEEAGLRAAFGADFDAYAARVRRWV